MDFTQLPAILTPDLGLLFWMLLAFLVVFFVLAKFGFPAIINMVDERNKYIDESLLKAREAQERLANIQKEGESILQEARAKQAQILKEAADTRDAIVEKGIELADLGDKIDYKIDTYSKGMMRRLLIARAIMTAPKLAILDEVTSGLDVINAYEIRKVIRQIAKGGVTVIMSSHNMFEVDMLCDRVGMIDQGNLIEVGTPEELKRKYGKDSLEEVFVTAVKGA